MMFRDYLVCGHSMLVEVLVDIDPKWRCRRDVGQYSFCASCPVGPLPRHSLGGMAISEIVRTTHVLAPGVEVDVDDVLHLHLVEMCEAAGFEPTESNKATLIEAARIVFTQTEIEVVP